MIPDDLSHEEAASLIVRMMHPMTRATADKIYSDLRRYASEQAARDKAQTELIDDLTRALEEQTARFDWCTQQKWTPDHHRPTPRAAPCAPPTHHAFDIDIYDCPCGHMYGNHEYRWTGGNDHGNVMEISRCNECSHG